MKQNNTIQKIPHNNTEIKKAFDELNAQNPILYDYAKTFYWTLLKYFSAYKVLSTGLIIDDSNSIQLQYHDLVLKGIKSVE